MWFGTLVEGIHYFECACTCSIHGKVYTLYKCEYVLVVYRCVILVQVCVVQVNQFYHASMASYTNLATETLSQTGWLDSHVYL